MTVPLESVTRTESSAERQSAAALKKLADEFTQLSGAGTGTDFNAQCGSVDLAQIRELELKLKFQRNDGKSWERKGTGRHHSVEGS